MKTTIDKNAQIKTDKWLGYASLTRDFDNLIQVDSGEKRSNFPDLHRCIMSFKDWQRGMHHQIENLQFYLDEYYYRFNRNNMKKGIFDNLLTRMGKVEPLPYKIVIIFKCLIQSIFSTEIITK